MCHTASPPAAAAQPSGFPSETSETAPGDPSRRGVGVVEWGGGNGSWGDIEGFSRTCPEWVGRGGAEQSCFLELKMGTFAGEAKVLV